MRGSSDHIELVHRRDASAVGARCVIGVVASITRAANRFAGRGAAGHPPRLAAAGTGCVQALVGAAPATAQSIALCGQQGHGPSARRTCRSDDATNPSASQRLDQCVDASRAVRPLPGEQVRAILQFPENLVALELPRDCGSDDLSQDLPVLTGVEVADRGTDLVDWVVALAGNAADAQWLSVAVAAGDSPVHAAADTGFDHGALAGA